MWQDTQPDAEHDDLALVIAAQKNRAAFEPLYLRYHRPIYLYCLRRLVHPEMAEDAASQVFVKAIVALPKFRPDPRRPGSTFRSWLFAIAHNVVIDAWRRHRPEDSLERPDGREFVDPAAHPEMIALASEEVRHITDLLALLPERQRTAVELRLAGLTTAEVANAMDAPFGATIDHHQKLTSTGTHGPAVMKNVYETVMHS